MRSSRLSGWLQRLLEAADAADGSSLDAERTLDRASDWLNLRIAQLLAVLFVVAVAAAAATDAWLLRDPVALRLMRTWRLGIIVAGFLSILAFRFLQRRHGQPFGVITALAVGASAFTAFMMASVEQRVPVGFLHGALLVPFGVTFLVVGLARRVALTVAVTASYVGVFIATTPSVAQHASGQALLMNLGFSVFAATATGHALYRLVAISFRQRKSLLEHAEHLEARVADATSRLRLLMQHIESSREDERRRIARELHDETSQVLAGMRIELAILRRAARADESLSSSLGRLDALVQASLSAETRIIRSLRPLALDEADLQEALGSHCDWLRERAGIDVDFSLRGDDKALPPALTTAVFRLVQEALTNVCRHAKASEARVEVDITAAALKVQIADDGVGFRESEGSPRRFGLLGMRERVAALRGQLAIDSKPGEGTRITVELPIPAVAPSVEEDWSDEHL